jgi:hypothetical protein
MGGGERGHQPGRAGAGDDRIGVAFRLQFRGAGIAAAQRPLKFGVRFSMNAVRPSL